MIHCLIKLSDTFLRLWHSLVRPAVSVQVPTGVAGGPASHSAASQSVQVLLIVWLHMCHMPHVLC